MNLTSGETLTHENEGEWQIMNVRSEEQAEYNVLPDAQQMRQIRNIVLDTSLFVNPDVRLSLGNTPTEALEAFLSMATQIHILEFYMPPSIFEELLHFVDKEKISGDLLLSLHQKPPKKHELTCPAFLLYELIEDIRERVNKGMRIAEKAVRSAENKKSDEIIQDMRRKYREALREGIIDSKEDVDLLLLSMELNAMLITADQGLIKWAEKLGVSWLFPEKFKDYLMAAIKRSESCKAGATVI